MHNLFPTGKRKFEFPCSFFGGSGGSSSVGRPRRQTEHPSNEAAELPHPALSQLRKLKAGNRAFHTAASPRQCRANAINCAHTDTHVSSPLPSAPESSRVRGVCDTERLYRGRDPDSRAQIRKSQTGLRFETWVSPSGLW